MKKEDYVIDPETSKSLAIKISSFRKKLREDALERYK